MRHGTVFLFACALLVCVCSALVIAGCEKSAQPGDNIYYCPMHPTYTSDRPGDCPICNMKLVKKKVDSPQSLPAGRQAQSMVHSPKSAGVSSEPATDEHKGHAAPPEAQEKTLHEVCIEHGCTMKNCPMMVRVALKPGEKISCPICGEYITTASGKLAPIASPALQTGPTVMISPEKQQLIGVTTAPVQKRHLAKTVRASGKIAYDPELFVTQEEFIQALNNEDTLRTSTLTDARERAKSLTEAARRKLKLLGMSEEQIAGTEKSRAPDRGLYLPGKGEQVWAYLAIYEYEIGLVKVGAPVELSAVAYPGEKFEGKVASINPVLDPMTRTNQVRVEVTNSDNKLKPEMYMSAGIVVDLGEKLAVPMAAVMDTGIRKIVYLSREGGVLESREIHVGQRAGDYYEILDGLTEGDIVATSGNFLIDSESKLKAAEKGTGHQH